MKRGKNRAKIRRPTLHKAQYCSLCFIVNASNCVQHVIVADICGVLDMFCEKVIHCQFTLPKLD